MRGTICPARLLPGDRCPPAFTAELRAAKTELLRWLNSPPCPGWRAVPPPDVSLVPLRPRPKPEDARRVVGFVSRQTNGAEALCAWCLRREFGYWQTRHWPDWLCCYAAARDAACWQLACSEAEAWERLAGFEEATV